LYTPPVRVGGRIAFCDEAAVIQVNDPVRNHYGMLGAWCDGGAKGGDVTHRWTAPWDYHNRLLNRDVAKIE